MADNIALPASGVSAATDDCGAGGHVQIMKLAISADGSATYIPADAGNGLDVDVTRIVPGTGATNLGKAEDTAHASGDVGVVVFAVRRDTAAVNVDAAGDYATLNVDANGKVWANAEVSGPVAEDAALSGNPIRQGGRAHSGVPTAMSADNDVVTVWTDRSGAQVVIPQPRQARLTATPTISTTGYVVGDQIGGELTFTSAALASGRGGSVVHATITSRTVVANGLELWLFQADPTPAGADNAAVDFTDANLEAAQFLGVIDFTSGDWKTTPSGAACVGKMMNGPVNLPFVTSGTANLFGYLVMRTLTGQYAGTTDLVVALTVNQF